MGQAEKRLRTEGSRGLLDALYDLGLALPALAAVFSTAVSILLVVAELVEPAAIAVGLVVIVTGLLLRYRANHRLKDRWYKKMRGRLHRELRFTRFWITIGATAIVAVAVLPPFPAMVVDFLLTLVLLVTGIAGARRSALIEKRLKLAKANAAEECDRVRDIAETAASIPVIRSPEYITRLAHYEVTPGEIGILPFLALAVIAVSFFIYVGLAAAVGISEAVRKDPPSEKTSESGDVSERAKDEAEPVFVTGPAPTYAEECPAIPNPLDIGHGLGQLFRSEGAFKAGCGTRPFRVRGTATWVSAGICDGVARSVAIATADGTRAIVYGDAANFAWTEAIQGNLLAGESAITGGGEVDLLETLAGTHAFTRLDAEEGNDDPRSCTEVTGTDRPFVHLAPQMVLLWLQLLEHRASWSWPTVEDARSEEAFAFTAYGTGEVTARGFCEHGVECGLLVDGGTWPGSGTSYVALDDLRPYMPED